MTEIYCFNLMYFFGTEIFCCGISRYNDVLANREFCLIPDLMLSVDYRPIIRVGRDFLSKVIWAPSCESQIWNSDEYPSLPSMLWI